MTSDSRLLLGGVIVCSAWPKVCVAAATTVQSLLNAANFMAAVHFVSRAAITNGTWLSPRHTQHTQHTQCSQWRMLQLPKPQHVADAPFDATLCSSCQLDKRTLSGTGRSERP